METPVTLSNLERQELITQFIEKNQRVTIDQLRAQFSISPATARRDLEILAEQGKIQRFHGGAMANQHAPPDLPTLQRASEQAEAKKRIGKAAAALIDEGDVIFLGSGTTTLEVARHLVDHKNLTVITNSLLVMNTLIDAQGVTLIALGGVLRRSELSFMGHLAELTLSEVRPAKVIMGVFAIDINGGITNKYLPETSTGRAIIKAGRELIVVADHTKFGQISAGLLASINVVNTIVTDSLLNPEIEKQLLALDKKVIKV